MCSAVGVKRVTIALMEPVLHCGVLQHENSTKPAQVVSCPNPSHLEVSVLPRVLEDLLHLRNLVWAWHGA